MKNLILILALLITNTISYATEIKGVIRKGTISLPSDGSDPSTFPKTHYDIRDLIVERLPNSISLSSIKINPQNYRLMAILGSLDLVSFTEKTGDYIYKLSIKITKLVDTNTFTNYYKPIDINKKALVNERVEISINGKLFKNEVVLENFNADNCGFSLTFDKLSSNRLVLSVLRDIPVSLYYD